MPLLSERDRCAHLLRRFGLGASEAEVNYYLSNGGLEGAINKLLEYDSVDEGFNVQVDQLRNAMGKLNMPQVVAWWVLRMLMTRRPLQERMTLFWHDHFATSAEKVGGPLIMVAQNEILRKNATGSFRDLLTNVSKDPAMIYWLDNQDNVKGHANENFAREVMELFTLGIGNYTEKDVQEGARAFTGWGLQRQGQRGTAEFMFREARHDDGSKTYLGNSGNFNGDDVLNILCDQPRTSEYLTAKLWDWFVWPKPTPETTAPFAERFRKSGLNIKGLLLDIMHSEEFYSDQAVRSIVKSPADFCIVTLRALGVGEQARDIITSSATGDFPRQALGPAAAASQQMKAMGMFLLYPPDVHGWDNGKSWITTSTMVERIGWGDRVFGQGKAAKFPLRYPAYGLFQKDPTPRGVVQKLLSVFDAPLKPSRIPILMEAAQKTSGGVVTEENANLTAAAVSRLIFASPEFQFS